MGHYSTLKHEHEYMVMEVWDIDTPMADGVKKVTYLEKLHIDTVEWPDVPVLTFYLTTETHLPALAPQLIAMDGVNCPWTSAGTNPHKLVHSFIIRQEDNTPENSTNAGAHFHVILSSPTLRGGGDDWQTAAPVKQRVAQIFQTLNGLNMISNQEATGCINAFSLA